MGFIYLLYNDAGYGYIGQTSLTMKKRIAVHNYVGNLSSSNKLGAFEWLVLEEVPNKDLADFERYYYDMYSELFPGMLVNVCVPLRHHLETVRDYRRSHKEQIKIARRATYLANKEQIKAETKAWREKNREKSRNDAKAYREKNKAAKPQ